MELYHWKQREKKNCYWNRGETKDLELVGLAEGAASILYPAKKIGRKKNPANCPLKLSPYFLACHFRFSSFVLALKMSFVFKLFL